MQQGKKFEVLKDRSKNLPDHGNVLGTIKESTGVIRPGDMSLRKLRAQVKQKVSRLNHSKPSVCKEILVVCYLKTIRTLKDLGLTFTQ